MRRKVFDKLASVGGVAVVIVLAVAGALLMFVGTPLLLGSWWGVLVVPLAIVGIGFRAVGEERMLCGELAGYEEYTRRVRYRMVPGFW